MTIDEKVEQILPKLNNIPNHFWALYQSCFGKTDDDDNEIQFLYNYMTDKRLIEPGTKEEEYIVLTTFGYNVLTDHMGWLNFLKTKDESNPSLKISIDKSVNQKIEIKDSVIHKGVTQSSDSSENKKNIIPAKAPMSIIKKIVIGVGIGLAVGLILYYVFGIGQ